jgi:hypothetical protein
MLSPLRITVDTTCTDYTVPDTAFSVSLQNVGLEDIQFSVDSCVGTTNFYTLKAGSKLDRLTTDNTQTLHFKTATGSSTLEILWD